MLITTKAGSCSHTSYPRTFTKFLDVFHFAKLDTIEHLDPEPWCPEGKDFKQDGAEFPRIMGTMESHPAGKSESLSGLSIHNMEAIWDTGSDNLSLRGCRVCGGDERWGRDPWEVQVDAFYLCVFDIREALVLIQFCSHLTFSLCVLFADLACVCGRSHSGVESIAFPTGPLPWFHVTLWLLCLLENSILIVTKNNQSKQNKTCSIKCSSLVILSSKC